MRTTRTLSVTLPPEMLAWAEAVAREEHRTMSELVREALRHYERGRWWDRANAYGRRSAEAVGVRTEAEAVKAIHDLRRGGRTSKRRSSRGR